jgi:hypothetical protein
MSDTRKFYEVQVWRQAACEYAMCRVEADTPDAAIDQMEAICEQDIKSLDWEACDGGDSAMPPHFYRALPINGAFDYINGPDAERACVADPDTRNLLSALRGLLEWSEHTGGWDAPAWKAARDAVAAYTPAPDAIEEVEG